MVGLCDDKNNEMYVLFDEQAPHEALLGIAKEIFELIQSQLKFKNKIKKQK